MEGGYVVSVPALPGCVSEGDSFEHAWEIVLDAMQGWIQVASEAGDPIPDEFSSLVPNGLTAYDNCRQTGSHMVLMHPGTKRKVTTTMPNSADLL